MPVNPDLKLETRTDVVLALLAAPDVQPGSSGSVVGITRMMKLLFLLEQEGNISKTLAPGEQYFDFEAYDLGPFDSQVYDALEFLQDIGLVEAIPAGWRYGAEEVVEGRRRAEELAFAGSDDLPYNADEPYEPPKEFRLTADGRQAADLLLCTALPDARQAIESVKRKYNEIPLRELLRYVYTRYPESAQRSKIRQQLGLG